MEKLYALAFLILPLFSPAQQVAYYSKPVPPGFGSRPEIAAPADDHAISADRLSKHIGKQVTLCSKVYAAKQQQDEVGPHLLLQVSGRYVNEFVDIRVRPDQSAALPADLYKMVSSKNVCLTGVVSGENEGPAMYLDSASLHKLLTEAEQAAAVPNNESLQDRPLKVISNAYLLSGPRWKDPVITFLKAGSVIVVEEAHGSWAFVRVIEKDGEDVEVDDIAGFVNTKPLGLGANGTLMVPR